MKFHLLLLMLSTIFQLLIEDLYFAPNQLSTLIGIDTTMEKINFGYSVKNIPLNNERNYKLRLIEKIEAVIKRIRWKATFYDARNERAHKEEVEDKVETYGLKSKFQNSMPSKAI